MCDTCNSRVHIVTCTYFLKKCYIFYWILCVLTSLMERYTTQYTSLLSCVTQQSLNLNTVTYALQCSPHLCNQIHVTLYCKCITRCSVVKWPLAHVLLETYCCKIQLWLNLIIMFFFVQILDILFPNCKLL